MAYFENLTLEKGMYGVPGKSFTQVLEGLDSSEQYRGTPLEGLDAYQRQLKRFGIRVSGPGSDPVEKFFQSSSSAALFPEYVARAVGQGMEAADQLKDMVATVTKIDGLDYRTITVEGEETAPLKAVAQGAQLPATTIRVNDGLVKLRKRGRTLMTSYEALRFQKLDLLTVALRQIGASMAASQMLDAVDALLNGDGSKPGVTCATGTPNYGDFIGLWGKLAPFTLNTVVAGTAAMEKLLQISEFKDAQAGMNFQGTGRLVTPLGAKLLHVPGMEEKKILAFDKNCALEMVQAGEIQTDYDRLMDRQLDRASISVVTGFARIYQGAAQGLTYTEA
ncbi:MAG TPA: phage major capsid protein [Candidatus Acutalibacter pullistercoris]|uniref:Phage major capsid protein n=1 Tax=Candidatus Acutalibacter pullistercoris TaxID=2838418 RepID=A0A9D1YDW8_9FIRM|nr:phage major capsid protein [Candidatus Acutalibacter pullistercoris]